MSTLSQSYVNALLADATYVNVTREMTVGELKSALATRMTPILAEYLVSNFEVASAINSSDNPLVGSGFDATVWRGKAGGAYADQVFVSMRGTEPDVLSGQGADLLADGDLALATGARSQIVDMVNWWLQITTPPGTKNAHQIWLEPVYDNSTPPVSLGTRFVVAPNVDGLGLISAAELAQGVQVNGHSLGGHLATAFSRIFGANNGAPGSINVQAISTFNSAGFNGSAANSLFQDVQTLLGAGIGSFAPISAKQTNFFASNGINVTTNTWWFEQIGTRTGLYQEETTGAGNHSMYRLTDLLALGAALEKLDPTFTIDKLNALVKAGSNDMKASYEGVLNSLRRALAGPNVETWTPSDASDSDPSRKDYHATLAAMQSNPIFQSLMGKLRIEPPPTSIATLARYDFGALIALQDLSPLYISGNTAEAREQLAEIWQIGRAGDYAAWQADKSATTPSRFTDQWIADRTTLLQAITKRNQLDITSGIVADSSYALDRVLDIQYLEAGDSTFKTLTAWNPANNGGGNALSTRDKQRITFGNDASDTLTGTVNKLGDHLYGSAGDDTLNGLSGNDYLEGGSGDDTYVITANSGQDTVLDADGLGHIELAGRSLNGAGDLLTTASTTDTSQPYTVWIDISSPQQPIHYVFNILTRELTITGSGSSVVVKNFSSGRLGIAAPVTLKTPVAPQAQTSFDLSLPGDRAALAMLSPAQQNNNLLLGNAIVSDAPTSVSGYSGNDVLLGGNIVATYGSVLNGGAGDDQLWATTASTLEDAIARGESAAANGSGTLVLAGGAGRDLVVGDVGDDAFWGVGRKNATKSIAACAYSMKPRGLFDAEMRAANNTNWRMAA